MKRFFCFGKFTLFAITVLSALASHAVGRARAKRFSCQGRRAGLSGRWRRSGASLCERFVA
jgi:hypothetical protein